MASTSRSVSERRLRPIYDALDTFNNKQAIQLADKVLKKDPILAAKALKAIALERLGKRDEGLALLNELKVVGPTDEMTLQAMTHAYRDMDQFDQIPSVYEVAVKHSPLNEELNAHLFMALVRINDPKRQQAVAMQMYKTFKLPRYYLWSAMSLLAQAMLPSNIQAGLSSKMLFPLLEKILEKATNEKLLASEEDLDLYLQAFERQGKHADVLKWLEQPELASLIKSSSARDQRVAEALGSAGRLLEAASKFQALLEAPEHRDQWSFFKLYLKYTFEHAAASPDVATLENAWSFVSKLVAEETAPSAGAGPKVVHRGPFLAQLEFLRLSQQRVSAGLPVASVAASLVELLAAYFARFGAKWCCFDDMRGFVGTLSPDAAKELHEKMLQQVQACPKDAPVATQADCMRQHICTVQLARWMGLHTAMTPEQQRELVADLVSRYHAGLQFGSALKETERQYSDDYALLATLVMLDLHEATGDRSVLYDIIALLQFGVVRSKFNFQFKLFLVQCYVKLGALAPALALYQELETRHVQQDTLSYVISDHLLSCANMAEGVNFHRMVLSYFERAGKELPEMVINAYRHQTFSKVLEFMEFTSRTNRSLQRAIVRCQDAKLRLRTGFNGQISELEEFIRVLPLPVEVLNDLSDNRDHDVMDFWEAEARRPTKEQLETLRAQKIAWVRLSTLTFNTLRFAAASDKARLQSTLEQLQAAVSAIAEQSFAVPSSLRLSQTPANTQQALVHAKIVLEFGKAAQHLQAYVASSGEAAGAAASISDAAASATAFISSVTAAAEAATNAIASTPLPESIGQRFFERAAGQLEVAGDALVFLSAFARVLGDIANAGKKNRKKPTDGSPAISVADLRAPISSAASGFAQLLRSLESQLQANRRNLPAASFASKSLVSSEADVKAAGEKAFTALSQSQRDALENLAEWVGSKRSCAESLSS
ncbi:hypothetical protein CAOG_05860 [Capsaspora owczarzaki ATCC 30864]|uniref:N-terminal acetyltransferase B complex subunit NAA25 homolog n=1 Tax=Capsaspora owczarzaki (strain ATCC 30864) TaxID=595528 RepID=A0A0D2UJX7_CAPO3|nr:hypothetical protein CAOG_05860 [Capsaspora owczarzaki ATCC 30864]KJE95406.1 hypothetical protein CAOG_005860 [Capsaspora owczarzaki ATCC 30864]|eukprot:XP_004345450.2 hypothetical protein CAOG_05860 [Capsaspora owczarzaki ATCC 30864]